MKLIIIKMYRFIFARKFFHKLNLHLYKLTLRNLGVLNSDSVHASGEVHMLKTLNNKLEIKTSFDIGANEGGYAKLIHKYIPNTKIYCFEPSPEIFKTLKKYKKNYMTIFNVGLSDVKKTAMFYDFNKDSVHKHRYAESSQASLYKDVFTKLHHEKPKSTKIKLNTLDSIVKELKINKIDYLKIDTEGAEFEVVKGSMKTIMKNRIDVIHFEFNEMNVFSRVYFRDFLEILPNYNFYRLLPNSFLPIKNYSPKLHEIYAFQNIVAIRADIDWN